MLSEFLNSINQTKENLIANDPKVEKEYLPFVVNKCFSYFPETVLHASLMNSYSFLDKKLQYDYYIHALPKKKRFSKWIKPENDDKLTMIKEVYGYSDRKAREVVDLLDEAKLKDFTQRGGQKR